MSKEEQISWHQNSEDSDYYKFEGDSFPSHNEDTPPSSFEKRKESPRGEEDGVKEDFERNDQSKKQKRIRSAELHNHNERLRRQRLKDKMKDLQELIPNCSKRDKVSTFDDAIKYIKALQNQVQVMAMGSGFSTSNHPQTMTPPFVQTCPPEIEILDEEGMKMETSPSLEYFPTMEYFPTSHAGFSDPHFLPPSAVSRLPAPDGFSAIQSPFDFTSADTGTTSLCPTSLESHGSRSMTSQSSQGPTSEQSSSRRESTTRVLPSKIVQRHHSKEEW